MLVNVFSGVVKRRIKDAMEKTLTGQFRGMVDWVDGVAFDIGERRCLRMRVLVLDLLSLLRCGVGLGRWRGREDVSMGVRATGTGIIFEERTEVPVMNTEGEDEDEGVGCWS